MRMRRELRLTSIAQGQEEKEDAEKKSIGGRERRKEAAERPQVPEGTAI